MTIIKGILSLIIIFAVLYVIAYCALLFYGLIAKILMGIIEDQNDRY